MLEPKTPRPPRRRALRSGLLGAVWALLGLAACGGGERAPAASGRPNVVLVTIDTLRSDRLSCYGYERPTSPHLDRFAEQCARFADVYSTSSFTPPSHASMFTSRYPGDHGLLTWNRLPDETNSLAEILRAAGYRTGASTNLNLLSSQNLGQGFAWGRESKRTEKRAAPEIVADGLEFLSVPSEDPFFLWLHFYDVHRPYGGSDEYKQRYRSHARAHVGDGQSHYNLSDAEVAQQGLSDEDLGFISDRYDAGINYVDDELAALYAKLSEPPYRDDTLVIVTSDHGEVLRERYPYFCHDPFLFRPVTQIPLLIRFPGGAHAGVVDAPLVSLIDLAPTVLDAVGLEAPASYDGASLLPAARGAGWSREQLFMENWGWAITKAIRTPETLIVHDVKSEGTYFYDLASDPAEFDPARTPRSPRERALFDELMAFVRRAGVPAENPTLGGATVDRLKELGYAE